MYHYALSQEFSYFSPHSMDKNLEAKIATLRRESPELADRVTEELRQAGKNANVRPIVTRILEEVEPRQDLVGRDGDDAMWTAIQLRNLKS